MDSYPLSLRHVLSPATVAGRRTSICGKSEKGSDDWRNGIPLCATHHGAFDAHLFGIEPITREIRCLAGIKPTDIGVLETCLKPLKNLPDQEALDWRWALTQKVWQG